MIKFHLNKAYKYVQSKSVIELILEGIAAGLGTLAISGITFMWYMILSGQVS